MARGLNRILLVGTLTKEPELRYTPSGLAILEINVAGNDHVIGDDNQARELAWYHRATVFGKAAENLANQLSAETAVFIDGVLNYHSWENQEGQRRSSLDVKAIRVEVLTLETRKGESTVVDSRGQHRIKNALNEVTLIGNLTRDSELRYTPSGSAVTRFSIAVNERFRDRNGQDQERTHYVDINVWRELAEVSAELKKGDPVFVVGRLVNDSWQDKEGNRRYATRVEGSRVEFLTRGSNNGGVGTQAQEVSSSSPAAKPKEIVQTSQLDIDEEFPPEEDLPF